MNETQIEKKADRIDQFQQRKRAEELTNLNGIGRMALRNAALEQLGHKIKEEEIITVSAKAEGEKSATWAAKCAGQNNSIPHVLCAILYPSHSKRPGCQNGKAKES